jgi:hypothetical protein
MATDGEWIYWTEDEGAPVYKVRPDGSGYTSTDPGLGILDGITVDDTYIYVFRNYTLWRMAKDFTGATIIANSGTKPIEHIQARGGYVYKLHAGAVDNWIDRSSDRGDTWTKLITLPAETIDIPTAFDVSDTGIRVSMGYGSIYTGWATYDLDGTNLQRILPNSRLSNTRNSAHLIGDTVYGFFGTDTKNLVRINRDGTQYRAITDVPTGGEPTDSLFVGTSVGDFTFIPSPAAVADFTGSSSDTGASLTWSAPTVPYGSAPITGYRIKYKLHSETEYGYSYDGEANALSWGISDLTPETEYDFSVSAISAAGVGEETVVMLTTGSEIPIFFNTTIMPA